MNKFCLLVICTLQFISVVNSQTINFSGYTWNVKNTNSSIAGPGDNYYDKNNVWVDANGRLHLVVKKNPTTGKWTCADVITQSKFGSGIYQFWVEGPIDQLDKNLVLGLFSYSGPDGWDEIDIEYAHFFEPLADNLNYTVYPALGTPSGKQYKHYNTKLYGTYTTQRYTRKYDNIHFQSLGGFYNDNTNEYKSYTFTNSGIVLSKPLCLYLSTYGFKMDNPQQIRAVQKS